MGTVQAFRALGLVDADGERFNGYVCNARGRAFLEAVWSDLRPRNLAPLDALTRWVKGTLDPDTGKMRQLLSPVEPLPEAARALLRDVLATGDTEEAGRRRAVLRWMDSTLSAQGRLLPQADIPAPAVSARHLHDLTAGTLFFEMQSAAMAVLDRVEAELAARAAHALPLKESLTEPVAAAVQTLRTHAVRFQDHDVGHPDADIAIAFARDCAAVDGLAVLERLLRRDERVLRLRDGIVLPGMAFDGRTALDRTQGAGEGEEDALPANGLPFPHHMSYRVRNAWLLNCDLRGRLDAWLNEES